MADKINWNDGQKYLAITPNTWRIKNVEQRLAAAKADLTRAGFIHDAGLLNVNRLNSAFYKLPEKQRAEYASARTEHTKAGKKRANKGAVVEDGGGPKKQRAAEAQGNLAVAKSLGLMGGSMYDVPEEGSFADDVADDDRGFDVAAVAEETSDLFTYSHPMCGGVLTVAGNFDNRAKSVLIVRASSAGLESNVGKPLKVDEYTIHIPVTRTNRLDFICQLWPTMDEGKQQAARARVNAEVTSLFGGHFTYEVLNTAFKAMVPESERWNVVATIKPPFMFGDVKDALVFTAANSVDVLVLLPLVQEVQQQVQEAKVMNFEEMNP